MPASNRTAAGGNKWMFGGFLDEFGFLTGQTPTPPAAGATGSPMFNALGVKSASPAVPEREAIQITGDDDLIGEIPLSSIASRRFLVEVAVEDLTRQASLQGTNVETFGEVKMGVLDIVDEADYDTCFILQSRALKQDDGVRGKKAWNGVMIALANAKPLGRRAFEERAAAAFGLDITPQLAAYNPWGVTLLDANAGTAGARYRPFSSEYPVVMERHTGTGAIATFNLSYKPVSANKMYVVVDRIVTPVLSVNTTFPYSYTLSDNPVSGAKIVEFYEFQP